MFLKAGLLSLMLLLVSRVLGVLRETALAAAFGSSGMADVAIVMMTLPDWLAGVLVSGALAYVLLPQWARESETQQNATQRRVAQRLLLIAVALAGTMCLARDFVGALLAPGVPPALRGAVNQAVIWSALALPAAMLAGLWASRLQHERDFVGLYSGNLVVNAVLIGVLVFLGVKGTGVVAGSVLGIFLMVAMVMRLLWQGRRLRSFRQTTPAVQRAITGTLPSWRIWMWAALGAGLPLMLPFVARTVTSASGEGALATFNYAWKLVELPLVLAIQLVASLAFPAIAQAHAKSCAPEANAVDEMAIAVRSALALAWTLACAAAAALLVGAPVITTLLFGWGRMQGSALEHIAAWGQVGAWGLLPQAVLAVALTVLASVGRMRFAVLAYTLALAVLLFAAAAGLKSGHDLMWALNGGFLLAAMVAWSALGMTAFRRWIPVRSLLTPLVALMGVALLAQWLGPLDGMAVPARLWGFKQAWALGLCALSALFVIASGWLLGAHPRHLLRS